MKKITLLCVICILLTAIPCAVSCADISVEIKNTTKDIITVSGAAPLDSEVIIQIYNPNKGLSDINLTNGNDFATMQYFGTTLSVAGAFSKDIKLNTETGGIFKVIVSVNGDKSEKLFPYYPYSLKTNYVSQLSGATNKETLAESLPEIMKIFGFEVHELYTSTEDLNLADVICKNNKKYTITTPDNAYDFIYDMLVLNAFIEKNELLFDENKSLEYSEIWVENSQFYADYGANLSQKGKDAVNMAMLSGGYTNLASVYDRFEETMLYNLIMNNALSGFGHIEGLFSKYGDEYISYGFNLSLLENAENIKTLYGKFIDCGATSLSTLAGKFNSIFERKETDTPSSGGGGFSGGGGGGAPASGGADTFVPAEPPSVTPEPTAPISACPFSDLSGAQWAKEAVEFLYKEGIVQGRSETEFAPNGELTRAELVKLVCEALNVADTNEEVVFGDVNSGDWFYTYVKKAAAAGIVLGNGESFNPYGKVTREDAALILFRALGIEKGEEISFNDKGEISEYAKEAVAAMVKGGYVSGMGDGTFKPKSTLTRAQAAQLIYNILTKGGNAA